MCLLRNQGNLLEELIAKEVSMDCIFLMTQFYRMVFHGDVVEGPPFVLLFGRARSGMRKA